jgi:ADP-heptose:LPS heptosyltransferase
MSPPRPPRIAQWASALPPAAGHPRIGVVWRGNPRHANDANRSIPLATFQALLDAPQRTFVPLQLDVSADEAALLDRQPAVSRLAGTVDDFADTAAILEHLDLVITVDTSVAHLAGAMGRPVWVLLPFAPDWRWMLRRSDSPWYPTMRLFRQPRIGDWDTVLATVRAELQRPGFAAFAPELAALPMA